MSRDAKQWQHRIVLAIDSLLAALDREIRMDAAGVSYAINEPGEDIEAFCESLEESRAERKRIAAALAPTRERYAAIAREVNDFLAGARGLPSITLF